MNSIVIASNSATQPFDAANEDWTTFGSFAPATATTLKRTMPTQPKLLGNSRRTTGVDEQLANDSLRTLLHALSSQLSNLRDWAAIRALLLTKPDSLSADSPPTYETLRIAQRIGAYLAYS